MDHKINSVHIHSVYSSPTQSSIEKMLSLCVSFEININGMQYSFASSCKVFRVYSKTINSVTSELLIMQLFFELNAKWNI